MLRDIWKNFNVSLVMVLPIFWQITDNVFSKREKIKYPFVQLVMECGLLNTFLFRNRKYEGILYLLFDKEKFNKEQDVTLSKYYSVCELLVDCEQFHSLELHNDYVVVGLKIPEKYDPDIYKIMDGYYRFLSKDYKDELYFRKRIARYPNGENKLATYIIANDLAYAISIKDVGLRDELKDIIGYDVHVDELYPAMEKSKEHLTPSILDSPYELMKFDLQKGISKYKL